MLNYFTYYLNYHDFLIKFHGLTYCLVNPNRKSQYQNYFFPSLTITSIKEVVEPMIAQIEIDHIREGQIKFNSKLDEIIINWINLLKVERIK
jgi:hypothetical protein